MSEPFEIGDRVRVPVGHRGTVTGIVEGGVVVHFDKSIVRLIYAAVRGPGQLQRLDVVQRLAELARPGITTA